MRTQYAISFTHLISNFIPHSEHVEHGVNKYDQFFPLILKIRPLQSHFFLAYSTARKWSHHSTSSTITEKMNNIIVYQRSILNEFSVLMMNMKSIMDLMHMHYRIHQSNITSTFTKFQWCYYWILNSSDLFGHVMNNFMEVHSAYVFFFYFDVNILKRNETQWKLHIWIKPANSFLIIISIPLKDDGRSWTHVCAPFLG